MNNAVIYARFSSHAQNEQSIEGQLHVCYEYAERHNLQVVGEYIDRALTGRSDNRPDFQKMITDSKKKAFQYVIVYKLDRFARNRYDSAIYKHKLKQSGTKVLSAMENIGDNPESIILEAVLEASAEYYSVDLSQKIKRGRRESAMKGKFIGGGVPMGYKNVNGNLVLDSEKAPYVKEAFEMYASGVPKSDIIKKLNAYGFRKRNGKLLDRASLQHTFSSKKYIGILDQSGIVVENAIPALIDIDTFNKCQKRTEQNRRTKGSRSTSVKFLLTGKIYCGECGASMHGICGTGKQGGRFYYYVCKGKRSKNGCVKKNEKKDFVEQFVVEETLNYILVPEQIENIAKSVVEEYNNEFGNNAINNIEKRIAYCGKEIDRLALAAVDMPKPARKAIYEKIEQLDAERNELDLDCSKLRIANKITYTEDEIKAWIYSFCNDGCLTDEEFCSKIIDAFINSVFVYDDKIVIYYNIKNSKQVSFPEMEQNIAQSLEGSGSSIDEFGGTNTAIDEHKHLFIFVNGLFGLIVKRD